ncbi:CGLD27 family protein [Dapis sp. BLCC M229]|uniref:CGLD27 family protein n=1 Tax=Dapis sp. BLCC M229 TaxID=3400188 RepID=UPI003CF661B5
MIRQIASSSPVPPEQQPANEYEELKNSWLFYWVTLERPNYLRKLVWVWVWSWLVSGPVAAASFPPEKYLVQFLLSGSAGASLILILVLLRLYLGWNYVQSRLGNTKVFYEESGWYDGQTWLKTPEEITKDRLILEYQVKPLLQRLRKTFYIFLSLIVIGGIIWFCV